MAELVTHMPNPQIQKKTGRESDQSDVIQMKPLATQITPFIQRQADLDVAEEEEEEEVVQTKQEYGHTPEVTPEITSHLHALPGKGRPLPESTRAFFEPRFGHDFSQVRVHTDTQAAHSAQAIHAKAYTIGRNIVFNTGHYQPHTTGGQHLLAHELTHVVQQTGGKANVSSPQRVIMRQEKSAKQRGIELIVQWKHAIKTADFTLG